MTLEFGDSTKAVTEIFEASAKEAGRYIARLEERLVYAPFARSTKVHPFVQARTLALVDQFYETNDDDVAEVCMLANGEQVRMMRESDLYSEVKRYMLEAMSDLAGELDMTLDGFLASKRVQGLIGRRSLELALSGKDERVSSIALSSLVNRVAPAGDKKKMAAVRPVVVVVSGQQDLHLKQLEEMAIDAEGGLVE